MTWAPCPNALLPFRSSLRQACVRQEVQLQSTQPLATRTRKYESYSQLGKKQSQTTVESSGTRWCKRWVGCNANAKGQFRNKQGTNLPWPSITPCTCRAFSLNRSSIKTKGGHAAALSDLGPWTAAIDHTVLFYTLSLNMDVRVSNLQSSCEYLKIQCLWNR